ncbi:LytTR family DNA-binding domain-containing protein [Pedobacter sp. L105]|uniref:LytR/AlgR family response regulator transcription factor n=1 Tax=Pedobacter sp. L105 TaxID=1641871 RepID=UPI00131B477C|nr:response regulator [Pedobacter sp. L105]
MASLDKTLKCIILDDEPLAQEQLEAYISKCEELVLVGKVKSLPALEELLANNKVNLLFLDVKFKGGDINEIGRLDLDEYVIIVFTAFSHKYLKDYNLDYARDILFKPFSFESFRESLDKVILDMAK